METTFRKGGLKNIAVKHIDGELRFNSAQEYWSFMTEISPTVVAGLARADDSEEDPDHGARFGAEDMARWQTAAGMVGLYHLGKQIGARADAAR